MKNIQALCHAWAHQTRKEGKCGNVSFVGGVLYSWRSIIAIIRHDNSGTPVVLMPFTKYSSGFTSKHMNAARKAVSHLKTFTIYGSFHRGDRVDLLTNQQIVDRYVERMSELRGKALMARSHKSYWMMLIIDVHNEMKSFCSSFGAEPPDAARLIVPTEDELRNAHYEMVEIRKKEEANKEKRKEENIRKQAAALEEWRAGGPLRSFAATALRLSADGSRVETSHGAHVTARAAVYAYGNYLAKVNIGNIDSYSVQSVDDQVIRIGCHTIPMDEVERVVAPLYAKYQDMWKKIRNNESLQPATE